MTDLPVVIFMTSNGIGMGHLSRQLTVALSGSVRFQSVLFSLSGALPRIIAADRDGELPEAASRGVRYEFCPSRESGWLPAGGWQRQVRTRYRSYRWHAYLRDRLIALAIETRASAVVFDGVVPYAGLLQARAGLPEVKFAWIRRGMWQPTAITKRLRHSPTFDLVIEPGDFGATADRGPLAQRTDATKIAPVSMVDVLNRQDRLRARTALGLPTDRPVLLLAPGSGALGSIESTADRVLSTVAHKGPEWTVAVTRQSIAKHHIGSSSTRIPQSAVHNAVVILDDVYPLARHLRAFDAAVGAAGYNSVHELLASGVPTLLIPSVHHATDDQGARAQGVADRQAALTPSTDGIESSVAALLTEPVRDRLRAGCADLEPADGGVAASDLVAALAEQGKATDTTNPLASPAKPWIDARTPTVIDSHSLPLFRNTMLVADARGNSPVEHLVEGSSATYRHARYQAAAWLYRPQTDSGPP